MELSSLHVTVVMARQFPRALNSDVKVTAPSLCYWACREGATNAPGGGNKRVGVVVLLGWLLSKRKHVASYVRLYESYGWETLVCHPQVLHLFFPKKATTVAIHVLDELVKDLRKCPVPLILAAFSGGTKAYLYKIIQILLGKCNEVDIDVESYDVVKRALAGLMFDSSPVDFVSHLGAKFVSHQMLARQPGQSIPLVYWAAYAVGKGLDVAFSSKLELQRVDMWESLYLSVKIPIILLYSEIDELAPVETIRMYASNLCKLGGDVTTVEWKRSEHVGHFRLHPKEYAAVVRTFLTEVASLYTAKSGDVRWMDLPGHVLAEIRHLSHMPHIPSKGLCKERTQKTEASLPLVWATEGLEIHRSLKSVVASGESLTPRVLYSKL